MERVGGVVLNQQATSRVHTENAAIYELDTLLIDRPR